jgi:hypothetical protein
MQRAHARRKKQEPHFFLKAKQTRQLLFLPFALSSQLPLL